ncbi:MAG: pantoate--beta-alanine ligase [Wenzhouxiangellaceae bacterium]
MAADRGPLLLDTADALARWRMAADGPVAFVPTMGNLHEGHLTLVREAARGARHVIVSIFVNPAQFGPGEDLERYPRSLQADMDALQQTPCAAVWVPDVPTMYPEGLAARYRLRVPESLAGVLCGAHRPGHFDGVCDVVLRLLWQVRPTRMLLGEKDYQQLVILRRMVRDLSIPVEVRGVPTVRDEDGLALSSRNAYLSEAERRLAPTLHAELQRVAQQAAHDGPGTYRALEESCKTRLAEKGFKPEYVEIRSGDDLGPGNGRNDRVFGAAWLGRARLIDNVVISQQICC